MNIGIALSRNYDKISIELLDEAISHETDEELKNLIKKKYTFLKECVLSEFEKPQVKSDIPKNEVIKPSEKQIKFLGDLGYTNEVTSKIEATELIKALLLNQKGEDY